MRQHKTLSERLPRAFISAIIEHLSAEDDMQRPSAKTLLGPQVWAFRYQDIMVKAHRTESGTYLRLFEIQEGS